MLSIFCNGIQFHELRYIAFTYIVSSLTCHRYGYRIQNLTLHRSRIGAVRITRIGLASPAGAADWSP